MKLLSAFVLLILIASPLQAETPSTYTFVRDTFEALNTMRWSLKALEGDFENEAEDSHGKTVTLGRGVYISNHLFERAKLLLEPYNQSEDPYSRFVVRGLLHSIDGYIESNQKALRILSTSSGPISEDEMRSLAKEIQRERREALINAEEFIPYMLYVLYDVMVDENSQSKAVKLNLNDKERETLENRINELFGKEISYFRKQIETGKPGDVLECDGLTWLIVPIDRVEQSLHVTPSTIPNSILPAFLE